MRCPVCMGTTDALAEYSCGHQICMVCSARLVFLYKQSACPLCRGPAESVVFSMLVGSKKSARQQWRAPEIPVSVFYIGDDVKRKMDNLLSNKCQKCSQRFETFGELKRHYAQHGDVLCSECVRNKKDFWNEIKLYKARTLRDHKNGDLNEEGFSGHVFCIHCKIYLFDSGDAKQHCNLKHQLCHVCDMLGTKHQYFSGLEDLEAHYNNAHYCCTFQACRANKCYVFPYQTELFEHLTRFHGTNIRLSEVPTHGKCNIPAMDPFKKDKAVSRISIVDQSGRQIGLSAASKPSPGAKAAQESSPDSVLPGYLDRSILEDQRKRQQRRRAVICRICKDDADDVEEVVNEFVGGTMEITEAFSKVSEIVGDTTALKLFEAAHFGPRQGVVSERIKVLKKRVMFPKFVPSEPARYAEPEKRKGPGFTVIDLHRKKER